MNPNDQNQLGRQQQQPQYQGAPMYTNQQQQQQRMATTGHPPQQVQQQAYIMTGAGGQMPMQMHMPVAGQPYTQSLVQAGMGQSGMGQWQQGMMQAGGVVHQGGGGMGQSQTGMVSSGSHSGTSQQLVGGMDPRLQQQYQQQQLQYQQIQQRQQQPQQYQQQQYQQQQQFQQQQRYQQQQQQQTVGSTSTSGGSRGTAGIPLPDKDIVLPKTIETKIGKVTKISYQFFKNHPEEWKKYNQQGADIDMMNKYLLWMLHVKKQLSKSSNGKQPGDPKVLDKLTQSATQELEADRQKYMEDAKKWLSKHFTSIFEPKNDEERQYLPPERLQSLAERMLGNAYTLEKDTEHVMEQIAEGFMTEAIAFAIAMARRRKKDTLDPADVSLFLKRAWNIDIPGYSNGAVTPYRLLIPKANHKQKLAAVRKDNLLDGKKYAVDSDGASGKEKKKN